MKKELNMADIKNPHEINVLKEELDYKINNIVATGVLEISDRLDLLKIARKFRNAEYNPERFPGLIYRQENPRATFLLFSTGKMVITGLEVIQNASIAANILKKKMKKIGIKVPNPKITIQNIVANGDLHSRINLNKATIVFEYAMYEPEVFPGLIYNMKHPRAVFLLFSTGKFVCTGVKNEEIIEIAILNIIEKINRLGLIREKTINNEEEELIFL
jgi:transcription initiation factor TFIID TATA-box-binding protein